MFYLIKYTPLDTISFFALKQIAKLITMSYTAMFVLLALQTWVPPPETLPDFYPVLFALGGAINFAFAYLCYTIWLLESTVRPDLRAGADAINSLTPKSRSKKAQ